MAKSKGCGCFPLLILLGAAGYGGYYCYDRYRQADEAAALYIEDLRIQSGRAEETRQNELNAARAAMDAAAEQQRAAEERTKQAEERAKAAEEAAQKAIAEAKLAAEKAQMAEEEARAAAEAAKNTPPAPQATPTLVQPDDGEQPPADTANDADETSATASPEQAEPLYGMSAAQIRELGVDYAEARNGKAMDEQQAIELYIKAAKMGDIKAQRWMGWRYRQGRGVPKDEKLAYAYFHAAAQQGDKAAAEAIGQGPDSRLLAAEIREKGVDYAEGRKGTPVNEQEAIRLYIQAADMGDIQAQRWMGWRYRQGRGVPKDEQQARAYFRAAAQQGDEAAAKALTDY